MCNIATFDRHNYKSPNLQWMLQPNHEPRRNLAIIFVGDIVDRFRPNMATSRVHGIESSVGEVEFEEKYLERAINDLSALAQQNHSVVIKLFGNHEFINHREELLGPYRDHGPMFYMSEFLRQTYRNRYPDDPNPFYSRVREFQPGGIMNYEVGECNPAVIFQLNQHVFVHGGISIASIEYADRNGRHLYEFANTVTRAVWSGTATGDEEFHFDRLVGRDIISEGTLLWDRSFSQFYAPPNRGTMGEYIAAVVNRLNEHNHRFNVPLVRGIVVAHTWPGNTVSQHAARHHLVCQKNGNNGSGYVIFTDTNASRSFIQDNGDPYQRERNPRHRVRPLHINQNGDTDIKFYGQNGQVVGEPVPL